MPRNRNQPAVIAPLTFEQETSFGGFGNLLTGERDEDDLATLVRLFGGLEAARAGWFDHRDELLARYATPGRRPCGYWLFEVGVDAPPALLQAAILRDLGVLTDDEEQTLREWAAMVPDLPDISITHPGAPARDAEIPLSINDIASADADTAEDPNAIDGAIDAAPEPARPQATIEASTSAEAREAPEGVPETPVTPVTTPRILPMRRGIDDRKPAEVEGWD